MRAILLFSFLCFFFSLFSQDFTQVDARARKVQASADQNITELANALTTDCTTEKEKVRAFYIWITHNIHYDTTCNLSETKLANRQQVSRVLKSKRAVCEGYSNLLDTLCQLSGIKSIPVSGITKGHKGKINFAPHAWNLVYADGQWGFVDATWGTVVPYTGEKKDEQYIRKWEARQEQQLQKHYFFPAPDSLIRDHYPNDPLFQSLPAPLSLDDFTRNQSPGTKAVKAYKHLADSLQITVARSPEQNLLYGGRRALKLNPDCNFGIFSLANYYTLKAAENQKKVQGAIEYGQKHNEIINSKWCSEQLYQVDEWEKNLQESIAISSKSKVSDTHSAGILFLQTQAQKLLYLCKEDRKWLQFHKAQVKKGG